MSGKNPHPAEVFGQELPSVAQEFSPQEIADLDARATASVEREAMRATQVERFMLMPISQKHRTTFVAVREVRDVAIYLQREYNALARDIAQILETYANKLAIHEELFEAVNKRIAELSAFVADVSKAEPPVERQLSLVKNVDGIEVPIS